MEKTRELRDGYSIPSIGFGTYPLRGEHAVDAIRDATQVGYRLIDTAFNYDNEGAIGRGIFQSAVPRDQLFVASKLPGRYHERPEADDAIRESLWRMGLEYFDLYMIHWPNPIQGHYVEAWEAFVSAQEEGLIRSVGVSNFTVEQLERLEKETGVLPVANQIECHPYFPQVEQIAAHEQMGIQTISWSPLGKASRPAEEPTIVEIARTHGTTSAQVVLRWQMQRGCIPIPKSGNPERIAENFDVFGFELAPEEMEAITGLGRPDGRLFDGDPNTHEEM